MTHLEKIQKGDSKTLAQNFVTKSGLLHKTVVNAINSCSIEGNKIYTKKWNGSGRHINLTDNSFYVVEILKRLGYKYSIGNDAPRGGKDGDFIKVSKKAMASLKSLIS